VCDRVGWGRVRGVGGDLSPRGFAACRGVRDHVSLPEGAVLQAVSMAPTSAKATCNIVSTEGNWQRMRSRVHLAAPATSKAGAFSIFMSGGTMKESCMSEKLLVVYTKAVPISKQLAAPSPPQIPGLTAAARRAHLTSICPRPPETNQNVSCAWGNTVALLPCEISLN